ncbi:unnamed protein product, partial [Phaeothamnion confervicola]
GGGVDGGGGDGGGGGFIGGENGYQFGAWERHTRGIGGKLMARMGYRRGEGLGKEKQGMSRPVAIRVLPPGRSLDFIR